MLYDVYITQVEEPSTSKVPEPAVKPNRHANCHKHADEPPPRVLPHARTMRVPANFRKPVPTIAQRINRQLYAIPSLIQPLTDTFLKADNRRFFHSKPIAIAGSSRESYVHLRPVTHLGFANELQLPSSILKNKTVRFTTDYSQEQEVDNLAGYVTLDSDGERQKLPKRKYRTRSRACNTHNPPLVSRSTQANPLHCKLRLPLLPQFAAIGNVGEATTSRFHRILQGIIRFTVSVTGLMLVITLWVMLSAAVFWQLEHSSDQKLLVAMTKRRNEAVIGLATELRQIVPYDMVWRKRIDEYMLKYENVMTNASLVGYYGRDYVERRWNYGNSLLLCISLLSSMGFGSRVPRTAWGRLFAIPCVLIGTPLLWLEIICVGAHLADVWTYFIAYCRRSLARRLPDVFVATDVDLPYLTDEDELHTLTVIMPSINSSGQSRPPGGYLNGIDHKPDPRPNSAAKQVFVKPTEPLTPRATGSSSSQTEIFMNGNAELAKANGNAGSHRELPIWTTQNSRQYPLSPPLTWEERKKRWLEYYATQDASRWSALLLLCIYPLLGTLLFGLWAGWDPATSLAWPILSLLTIIPADVTAINNTPQTSTTFQVFYELYVLCGFVLATKTSVLWKDAFMDKVWSIGELLGMMHYKYSPTSLPR